MNSIEEIINYYCKDEEIAEAIISSLTFNGFGNNQKVNKQALIDQAEIIKNNIECSESGSIWLMHYIANLKKESK